MKELIKALQKTGLSWRFEKRDVPFVNVKPYLFIFSGHGEWYAYVKDAREKLVLCDVWRGDEVKTVLLGEDEQYFATCIPCEVKDLEETFNILTPYPVKEARRRGLDVRRQGEWHFVPLDEEESVAMKIVEKENLFSFIPSFPLGLHHTAEIAIVIHRHARWKLPVCLPEILVQGMINARNHSPLYLPEWHKVYRNYTSPLLYPFTEERMAFGD
ncbi:hypothetical protein DRQ18_04020 [bacterium]|nr:MAG: hypothetical protein DRQ18_04020 [bacterium]